MFGLDFGTIGSIMWWVLIGLVLGFFAFRLWLGKVEKTDPARAAAARAEAARLRAGEFDRADDLYKQTPLYEAAKKLENVAELLAQRVKNEIQEARGTPAVAPAAPKPPVSGDAAESLEDWAKRNGMTDRIQELKTVASIHPALSWEEVGALVNDPVTNRDVVGVMTPGDRSTVAAATGYSQQ